MKAILDNILFNMVEIFSGHLSMRQRELSSPINGHTWSEDALEKRTWNITLQRTIFTIGCVENDMAKKDGPTDSLGR